MTVINLEVTIPGAAPEQVYNVPASRGSTGGWRAGLSG
jgi:hypothetical protein